MGGESSEEKTQTQSSTPTIGGGLLGSVLAKAQQINPDLTTTETNALDRLSANAAAGNPFAPAIGGVTNTLLAGGGPDRTGMINDAYAQYQKSLASMAAGDYLNPQSNPALQGFLSTISNDVTNRVNGMFAGAGRDLSGANQGALARGITEGQAPVLVDAYNRARADQLAAQDKLFAAGGQTAGLLSSLDQTRLNNQLAGITAADAANTATNWGPMQELAIEAQRRGIPLQTLAAQFGLAMPAAQAFATKTGTDNTTKEMSGAEQFQKIGSGAASFASAAAMMF